MKKTKRSLTFLCTFAAWRLCVKAPTDELSIVGVSHQKSFRGPGCPADSTITKMKGLQLLARSTFGTIQPLHERSLFPATLRRPHRRPELRQRHRDLQVREDQAGEAEGPGRAPRAEAGRFRHRRKRRHGRRQCPPGDGRRDRQAGEPRLCRQRHRRLQRSCRPLHATRVPGGTRSRCARSITASARRRRWPCCPRPSSTRAT